MIGKALLHYEILERIGSGGMGEVYRARDTKLGREIAVKVLPPETAADPERRKRFHREAMAVAALKHPNIVTIHSVEEDGEQLFLTMELIEGRSLADLVPTQGFTLSRLLGLALPVADAISYAHKQGITHRDLKPSNIMLDAEGRPKVLDFGLAKLLAPQSGPATATLAMEGTETAEGHIIGTAAYMSPEQAQGKPVDARSDVFSLGVVLYEMATGERPFQGDTSISTISSILKDTPPLVNDVNRALPRHLGRVVNRCLAKDPERRYQSALEVRNELEGLKAESSVTGMEAVPFTDDSRPRRLWMGVGGAVLLVAVLAVLWQPWQNAGREATGDRGRPARVTAAAGQGEDASRTMIVVLPFENLGPPEDAYFAAGVTEEINSKLSAVPGLGVISRTSARRYAGTDKSIREIGEELGVQYVVEGTVRWQKSEGGAGRVRVSPNLVRVSDATRIWTSQYDQQLADIFEIQDTIAGEIVGQLGMALAMGGNDASPPPTSDVEAYKAYLQGVELFRSPRYRHQDHAAEVEQLLTRAVELDPEFALAWARLSYLHSNLYHDFVDRTESRLSRAREAADRAQGLDPDLPDGYIALGYYYYWGRQDYQRALEEFGKLGDRVENDAELLSSIAYVKRRQGKWDETLANLRKAIRLSPRDIQITDELAYTLRCMRQYEESLEYSERQMALAPEVSQPCVNAAWTVLSWTGDLSRARLDLERAPDPRDPGVLYTDIWFTAGGGDDERALELLAEHPEDVDDGAFWYLPRTLAAAVISSRTSDRTRTLEQADAARVFLEKQVAAFPQDYRMRGSLGMAYALLGRADDAIREAKLGVDLMSMSRDHLRGAAAIRLLAAVETFTGDADAAVDHLEFLLSIPFDFSRHDLRVDVIFSRLKGTPRFDALVEGDT